MKFEPRMLFLITSIICLIFVIENLYNGPEYDGIFWIAVMWVFLGFYLYKYPMEESRTT